MKVMLAGASEPRQFLKSYRSFRDMHIRDGDVRAEPNEFTRGDITRAGLCDEFLDSKFDALLLLDLDMIHPRDMLENLRSWDVDMVTAHYWKRQTPMESVVGIGDKWPYESLKEFPTSGLMEVKTSGFGAVLIKRKVIEDVAAIVPKGEHPMAIGPAPEMANGEVPMGSDMRFFHYAQSLGYKLWLDCGVESLHACNMWLSRDLYRRLKEPDYEVGEMEKLYQLNLELYGASPETALSQLKMLEAKRALLDTEIGALKKVIDG